MPNSPIAVSPSTVALAQAGSIGRVNHTRRGRSPVLVRVGICALLAAVSITAWAPSARAWNSPTNNVTSPPWYAHAWYITSDTPGKFCSLGQADGGWDNSHGSTVSTVILMFG